VATDLVGLCDDLMGETAALTELVGPLDDAGWATPTPAPGWNVRDQVGHLAYFDDAALASVADPAGFRDARDLALADPSAGVERAVAEQRDKTGPEVLAWLKEARAALITAVLPLDPGTRVPWYGPDMSVASSITARIMETWAHGQDVADALGVTLKPTARLRHVAFIGARAFANSYLVRGLPVPQVAVRVELTGPGRSSWVFGPTGSDAEVVRGSALDFCLVVTQRRHFSDTDLVASGPVSREWLGLAQAFAGPPGPGRTPGQFS
jgi:uncharacterized protein (TIGR03084 family)